MPIDTTESIYENFSEWKSLDPKQIVDELVKLGLWGGIRRAARAPQGRGQLSMEINLLCPGFTNGLRGGKLFIRCCVTSYYHLNYLPRQIPPEWVTTAAFAMCFYHGMRQALYHALETFVLTDKKTVRKDKPCLWIEWNDRSVSIYNRGEVNPAVHPQGFQIE